jgi:hypothetical protein
MRVSADHHTAPFHPSSPAQLTRPLSHASRHVLRRPSTPGHRRRLALTFDIYNKPATYSHLWDLAASRPASPLTTMVYENSGCNKDEIRAMHALVTQVSRAFFDSHFVILMDRMMTSDM